MLRLSALHFYSMVIHTPSPLSLASTIFFFSRSSQRCDIPLKAVILLCDGLWYSTYTEFS